MNHHKIKLKPIIYLFQLFLAVVVFVPDTSGKTLPQHPLFGITIENLNTFDLSRLNELTAGNSAPLTIRVIFQDKMLPSDYQGKLEEIERMNSGQDGRNIYVLATLYDSDYLAKYKIKSPLTPDHQYNCGKLERDTKDYRYRTYCFVKELDRFVDIWEVGNEVNGEWADEGCKKNRKDECKAEFNKKEQKDVPTSTIFPKRTIEKIEYAVTLAKSKDKPIALTLLHQPKCTTWTDNDMFKWSEDHITDFIRFNTDYLLVSYYEYNCKRGDGTQGENYWKKSVFDQLRDPKYFPNSYLGFGEVGYPSETVSCKDGLTFCDKETGEEVGKKIPLMNKYYGIKINDAKFVGGYFWWTFQQDITCPAEANRSCLDFYSAVQRQLKGNQ